MSPIALEERKRTDIEKTFLFPHIFLENVSAYGIAYIIYWFKRYYKKNLVSVRININFNWSFFFFRFDMTRNNRAKSSNTTSPSPTAMKDTFIDLPDLSKFRDEEKRHILNVLERDENLRNQHLLRFMYVQLNRRMTRCLSFFILGILEKKSRILNNNLTHHLHLYVRDVKHHLGLYLTPVMTVRNAVRKFVSSVDYCTMIMTTDGCVNCAVNKCKSIQAVRKYIRYTIFCYDYKIRID